MNLKQQGKVADEMSRYANRLEINLSEAYRLWLEPGQQAQAILAEAVADEYLCKIEILVETLKNARKGLDGWKRLG